MKEINNAPLLSAEEEWEYARRILEESDPEAREQMIKSNLRLVVNIAKSYSRRGLPLSDLIEEGNLGLLAAVERFDPQHERRFSTYASYWIKQSIKRALSRGAQAVHIPAYMHDMVNKYRAAKRKLKDDLGQDPTASELASFMELPVKKVEIVARAFQLFGPVSQAPSSDDDEMSLSDMLADDKTPRPEDAVIDEAAVERVGRLLDQIDERESTILRLRFGMDGEIPMTLKEVGAKIGLTRERVRQIEALALKKLNEILSDE